MWRLDVSAEAELEIFEAALRHERERADLGFRFEAQVNTILARVLANPSQFPEIDEALGAPSSVVFRTARSSPLKTTSLPCLPSFI
jgi:hypothetical protein